jgi:hypothetical protein
MYDLPRKANPTAIASRIAKDLARANFVRSEDGSQFLCISVSSLLVIESGNTHTFIHVLRDIRDVKVRVVLITELLELGIK